jgi:hypothetical protein
VKKIFGIAIALALVLSMSVMAAPAGAATLDPAIVIVDNAAPNSDVTGQDTVYTIIFTPNAGLKGSGAGGTDRIDITFPATTSNGGILETDILDPLGTFGGVAAGNLWTIGGWPDPITLSFIPINDCLAGDPITIVIGNVNKLDNPNPCVHHLQVGTSLETAVESYPYTIYLHQFTLVPGWNLISIPGIPSDTDIEVVLKDLLKYQEYDNPLFEFAVYYYDCGEWYAYNNGSYATLETMDECKAYWIKVNMGATFRVHGTFYPAPPGPPLKKCYHECWNMVGFTSNEDREPLEDSVLLCPGYATNNAAYMASMSPSLTGVPATIVYILSWTDGWVGPWVPIIQGSDCLVVGEGYWMSFNQDACFTPPPPGT